MKVHAELCNNIVKYHFKVNQNKILLTSCKSLFSSYTKKPLVWSIESVHWSEMGKLNSVDLQKQLSWSVLIKRCSEKICSKCTGERPCRRCPFGMDVLRTSLKGCFCTCHSLIFSSFKSKKLNEIWTNITNLNTPALQQRHSFLLIIYEGYIVPRQKLQK